MADPVYQYAKACSPAEALLTWMMMWHVSPVALGPVMVSTDTICTA
jgi:hypothetical protein